MHAGPLKLRVLSAISKVRRLIPDGACILLLLLLCLPIGLSRYSSGMDLADEGCLAYGAVRVLDGQIPNRDFVTLQPPLSFYIDAATFKLLGVSLFSLRIVGLCIYILIPLLIYGIARNLTGPPLSFAAAVPALVLGMPFFHFVPLPVWQGITASLATALLFFRATALGPFPRAFALSSGLLTALSLLLRQDQGFYLVISILVGAAALRFAKDYSGFPSKSLLRLWGMGLLVVLLPFTLYWIAKGALSEMVRQLLLFPLTTYAKTSSLPFPTVASGLTFGPNCVSLLYYLVPLLGLLAAGWLLSRILRRSFHLREAKLTFVLVLSVLFYCQVLARSDLYHLFYTLPPFFVLCVWSWAIVLEAIGHALARADRPPLLVTATKTLASIVAGTLLAGFLLVLKPVFLAPPVAAAETVLLDKARIRKTGAANLKQFVQGIQRYAPADRSILCLPYQPMFYFLCERRNPTRWNYLWPGDQSPADHQALINQAKSDPPAVVIVTGESDFARYAPEVLDYIHTDYRLAAKAGGVFSIYLPGK